MYIDIHQHFWKLERGDYAWMSSDYKAIFRDFLPGDLISLIKKKNISQTIIIQAADTIAETEFTLNIANENDFVSGVVGWVDFEKLSVKDDIDRLSESPYLKGFRPMIHDILDDNWMLRDSLKSGLSYLSDKGLSFDALVRPNHLSNLIAFAQTYNELPIVIDHIAKPRIVDGEIDRWMKEMTELASLDNVYCKFSGIVTEVGEGYTSSQIAPYIDFVLKTFDTKKLMWGSDWPVLTIAENYGEWFDLAMQFCSKLSKDEQLDIFANTAKFFYRV